MWARIWAWPMKEYYIRRGHLRVQVKEENPGFSVGLVNLKGLACVGKDKRGGMHELELTNLDKLFWPEEGLTKFALIKYYIDMAPVVLTYLKGRPIVMKRYPDGITGKAFYQKECPDYAPPWVDTLPVYHPDSGKTINYILCNNPYFYTFATPLDFF